MTAPLSGPRPRAATVLPLLGERHWRVLDLLFAEPLLATGHVQALVFTEGTPLSRARSCRRVLRELTMWGLVHRERAVPGGVGGGSDPAAFALTTRGERVLALRDGRSPGKPRRPADRGQALTRHLLGVADLHIALAEAVAAAGGSLRWHAEPTCWRRFTSEQGEELLKPDALAEVRLAGEHRLAWVELDRGTQSVPVTIAAKVRRYCRAAQALARVGEAVPLVAVVAGEARRRTRIVELLPGWASAEGVDAGTAGRLFLVGDAPKFISVLVDA